MNNENSSEINFLSSLILSYILIMSLTREKKGRNKKLKTRSNMIRKYNETRMLVVVSWIVTPGT